MKYLVYCSRHWKRMVRCNFLLFILFPFFILPVEAAMKSKVRSVSRKSFPVYWQFRNIQEKSGWDSCMTRCFVSKNVINNGSVSNASFSFVESSGSEQVRRLIHPQKYYPMVENCGMDDYFLFKIPVDTIQAGATVDFFMPLSAQKNTPKYFRVEYWEEHQWKSISEDLSHPIENSGLSYTQLSRGNTNYPSYISQIISLEQPIYDDTLRIRCRAIGTISCENGLKNRPSKTCLSPFNEQNRIMPNLSEGTGPQICYLGHDNQPEATYQLLFIGNSFTYYNVSPIILKELSWTNGGAYIKPHIITRGGQCFGDWISMKSQGLVDDIIKGATRYKNGYDYVILQDQSQTPAWYAQHHPDSIASHCRVLVHKIRKYSPDARIILEATWAFPAEHYGGFGSYQVFDSLMWKGAVELAHQNHLWVSPIGYAFKYVRVHYPEIQLYAGDEKHPSYAGSYLKSCVNYLLLHGQPFSSTVSNGHLDPTTATRLQQAAEKVVLEDFYHIAADFISY